MYELLCTSELKSSNVGRFRPEVPDGAAAARRLPREPRGPRRLRERLREADRGGPEQRAEQLTGLQLDHRVDPEKT